MSELPVSSVPVASSALLLRHYDIVRPSPLKIAIIGAGGIGSMVALTLAKIGYQDITVYDHDRVEEHNVASQFYRLSDLGRSKLDALKENVLAFTGVHIRTSEGEVSALSNCADIIVMAIDNMRSRKQIFENSSGYQLYIDGRMGGQIYNIFSFTPFDSMRYQTTLFTDDEADPTPCTAKAIAYNTFGIASQIANIIKRFDKKESFPFEINGDYVNIKLHTSR